MVIKYNMVIYNILISLEPKTAVDIDGLKPATLRCRAAATGVKQLISEIADLETNINHPIPPFNERD